MTPTSTAMRTRPCGEVAQKTTSIQSGSRSSGRRVLTSQRLGVLASALVSDPGAGLKSDQSRIKSHGRARNARRSGVGAGWAVLVESRHPESPTARDLGTIFPA
jgi:hypothetical protein